MKTYLYDGPVYSNSGFIGNYKAYTTAPSIQKAKSNITYRIKKDTRQEFVSIDQIYLNEVERNLKHKGDENA